MIFLKRKFGTKMHADCIDLVIYYQINLQKVGMHLQVIRVSFSWHTEPHFIFLKNMFIFLFKILKICLRKSYQLDIQNVYSKFFKLTFDFEIIISLIKIAEVLYKLFPNVNILKDFIHLSKLRNLCHLYVFFHEM